MSGIPLAAQTQIDVISVSVSEAYGSAGALVDNATDSISVLLINIGGYAFEYKVGAAGWVRLKSRATTVLEISLASTQLRLRKSEFAGACSAQLNIESLSEVYLAGEDVVDLGEGGGAAAFTDLTDAPPAYAGFAGHVPFVNSTEDTLAFGEANQDLTLTSGNGANTNVVGGADGGQGPGNAYLRGGASPESSGGNVTISGGNGATGGGSVSIQAGTADNDSDGNVSLLAEHGYVEMGSVFGDARLLVGTALKINGTPAVATQSVLVAGVGTMVFTHGLLTTFTPA